MLLKNNILLHNRHRIDRIFPCRIGIADYTYSGLAVSSSIVTLPAHPVFSR